LIKSPPKNKNKKKQKKIKKEKNTKKKHNPTKKKKKKTHPPQPHTQIDRVFRIFLGTSAARRTLKGKVTKRNICVCREDARAWKSQLRFRKHLFGHGGRANQRARNKGDSGRVRGRPAPNPASYNPGGNQDENPGKPGACRTGERGCNAKEEENAATLRVPSPCSPERLEAPQNWRGGVSAQKGKWRGVGRKPKNSPTAPTDSAPMPNIQRSTHPTTVDCKVPVKRKYMGDPLAAPPLGPSSKDLKR